MARYTDESKERVRDAVDMIDLVSARTELRRAGANRYEGLCPFHEERTPSFGIDPLKKVYHCFGCGVGGDVFKFVQETEGLDFGGAIESLADRYGVELEREHEDPQAAARRERRERLMGLLERTAAYYARYLWESPEAGDARVYLAGRGLDEETLKRFRVGYAPKPWDHMVLRWKANGFSDEELVGAGVAKRGQRGGLYDPFRGRLTFPLADLRGRVLGFAGRGLRDDQRPKYLNSPEGELFHKGQQLFGGDVGRSAAAKAQSVVLVEGYTDVIALHQAGIDNAVGMMGTALTERQVGEVARLVGPGGVLHIALDADASGQEAMLRAGELAAARDLRLDVVVLPGSSDPAELLAEEGVDAMRSRIGGAVPLATFRVERVFATADLESTDGRNRAYEALRGILGTMSPSPEREDLVRRSSSRLGIPATLFAASAPTSSPDRPEAPGAPARAPVDRRERAERSFLALCVALPEQGREALRSLDPDAHFTTAVVRRAAVHLRDHITNPGDDLPDDEPELASLITELMLRAAGEPADRETLRLETLQLEKARLEREILAATADGRPEVSDLAAKRNSLQAEIDSVMAAR